MRKILSLIAVFCCTMFLTAPLAKAADLKDKAVIKICGVQIDSDNKAGITSAQVPELTSGTISYDDTKHILTLDEPYVNMYTGTIISIDASQIGADFTIKVKGTSGYLYAKDALPLHFKDAPSGKGLIIDGEEDAAITFKTFGTGSFKAGAIVCRKAYGDETEASFFPLTISGKVKVVADNSLADGKEPLTCHHLVLKQVKLQLYACESGKYMETKVPASNVFEKMYEGFKSSYVIQYDYYNKDYPIWIGGVRLNDVKNSINSKAPLTSGSASYDDATRTLTLHNIKMTDAVNEAAILVDATDDEPTKPITVVLGGSGEVTGTSATKCFVFKTPVVLKKEIIWFNTFKVTAEATAIEHNSTLTIAGDNGKLNIKATDAGSYGIYGNGSKAELIIDHTILTVNGKDACIEEPAHQLKGVKPDGTAEWADADKSPKDGGSVVADTDLKFIQTEYVLSATADPAAAGKVNIKVAGAEKSNPYYHDGTSASGELEAVANTGYVFTHWDNDTYETDPKKSVSISSGNGEYVANFIRDVKTTVPYYIVDGKKIKALSKNFREEMTEIADIDAPNTLSRVCYYDGKIYYFDESSPSATFYAATFTPDESTKIGTKEEVVASQSDYSSAFGLVYSEKDECFYAIMYDNAASKYVLCKIVDGVISVALSKDFSSTYGLAVDASGNLYSTKDGDLLKINVAAGTVEKVGAMGFSAFSAGTIAYDATLGKLIIMDSNYSPFYFYIVDPATGAAEKFASQNFMDPQALFAKVAPTPDPSKVKYPVYVCGKQLTSKKSTVTSSDLAAITAGSVSYDEASATLTLNAATINMTATGNIIKADNGETVGNALNVVVNGDCKLTAADVAMSLRNFKTVKFAGADASSKLTIKASHGIQLNAADLTIEGLPVSIDATTDGISGSGNEALSITGAKVAVKGASDGSIISIKSLKTEYCSIDANHQFVSAEKFVAKTSDLTVAAKDEVTFTPDPMLTITPVEEGTGHFELKCGDKKFTDKGWFKAGDEISIVAVAEKGFEFGHWTDDPSWTDPDAKVAANKHATITMPSADKEYNGLAIFYYKSSSSAKWYGINDGKFVAFSMKDYGAKVIKTDHPDPASVKAGDFVNGQWYFLDGSDVKSMKFSGLTKDDQELDKNNTPKDLVTGVTLGVTDIAYDILNRKAYVVDGSSKLYVVNEKEAQLDEVGDCEYEENPKKVVAIAFDGKKVPYLLSSDDGGVLYTGKIDTKNKKIILSLVGKKEDGGKVGIAVANTAQSIAFDHAKNEILWGEAKYLRVINPSKGAKAYIAGDLGQADGSQGVVKSLHNMAKAVSVSVEVADGQSGWGDVDVAQGTIVSGMSTTITATANSGYHFVYWIEEENPDDQIAESTYDVINVTSSVTYVAYFAEGEGIESITIDPSLNVQKVLIDGVIYIVRDGRIYTITGQMMK